MSLRFTKTAILAMGLVLASSAQATTFDLNLTGIVSQETTTSFNGGSTHYDQWDLALSSFTPFNVTNGDTVDATISLDKSFIIPASVQLTTFSFFLNGSSFPVINTGVNGTTTFFNQGVQVASDSETTTTSSQLANNAVFFPPNNGALTFNSLTSNFTITTLSQAATVDSAAISYTLFSPLSAVPEADEWAMMLLGLPLLGCVVRRKQSAMQIATA